MKFGQTVFSEWWRLLRVETRQKSNTSMRLFGEREWSWLRWRNFIDTKTHLNRLLSRTCQLMSLLFQRKLKLRDFTSLKKMFLSTSTILFSSKPLFEKKPRCSMWWETLISTMGIPFHTTWPSCFQLYSSDRSYSLPSLCTTESMITWLWITI